MSSQLKKEIVLQLFRKRILILSVGLIAGFAMCLYAFTRPKTYIAKATVFPLNNTNESASATNAITSLLGLSEIPKSFSAEASINIIELAKSRNAREAVAMQRIPALKNKTVAESLIELHNQQKLFFLPAIKTPQNPAELAAKGAELLEEDLVPKLNKNGILEITFTCTNEIMAEKVAYAFIQKIAGFYKELRIKKALLDYQFMASKVDSLDKVLNAFDAKVVGISNRTLFVAPEKLQYQLPKENVSTEKARVMQQRAVSVSNREDALWRLQKATPIIEILDKPNPPFDFNKPSAILFGLVGLLLGIILTAVFSVSGLVYRGLLFEMGNYMK